MPGGSTHRVPHRPGLDGLRGIAVALVVAFHVWPGALPGGFLGVSLFFTLSGYLITNLLLAEHDRDGRIDLRSFWARRFRRLLPAALVVLAVVTLLGRSLPSPSDLGAQVLWALGNLYNWWLIATSGDYGQLFATPSPVEHFWSLAIEEQFYVVFPLVAFGLLRVGRRTFGTVMAAALAGSVLLTVTGAFDPATTYLSTFTRAAEILAGVLLAFVWPLHRSPDRGTPLSAAAGLAAIGAIVALSVSVGYDDPIVARGLLPITAVLSCLAIVFAAGRCWSTLLAPAVLTWMGRRSYGIYLVHWPVIVWLEAPGVVQVAVSLVLAEASYRIVEAPVRTRRVLARPHQALLGTGLAVSLVVALVVVDRAPERDRTPLALVPTVAERSVAGPTAPAPGEDPASGSVAGSEGGPDGAPADPAAAAAPVAPLTVWVMGDSQADGILDAVTARRDPDHDPMRDDADTPMALEASHHGRDLVVVDLAVPGCDGGTGTQSVMFGGRVSDDERCSHTAENIDLARRSWGPPDVVIWMVGASTVSTPRTFPGDAPDHWRDPLDPEWQRWWAGTAGERLDRLASEGTPPPPVLWVTPMAPVWSEDADGGGSADHRNEVERLTEAVGGLQGELAAPRPSVHVADLGRWVRSGGPGGSPVEGTVDGIHWGRLAATETVWPWLLDQALPLVGEPAHRG